MSSPKKAEARPSSYEQQLVACRYDHQIITDGPLSLSRLKDTGRPTKRNINHEAAVAAWNNHKDQLDLFDGWFVRILYTHSNGGSYRTNEPPSARISVFGPDWVFVKEFLDLATAESEAQSLLGRLAVPVDLNQLAAEHFKFYGKGSTIASEAIGSLPVKPTMAFMALVPTVDDFHPNYDGDRVTVIVYDRRDLQKYIQHHCKPFVRVLVTGLDDASYEADFDGAGEEVLAAARDCLGRIGIPVRVSQLMDLGFKHG